MTSMGDVNLISVLVCTSCFNTLIIVVFLIHVQVLVLTSHNKCDPATLFVYYSPDCLFNLMFTRNIEICTALDVISVKTIEIHVACVQKMLL